MNESFEQPQYRRIDDEVPPTFGEIRIDTDGNRWMYKRAHHTKSEEDAIRQGDLGAFWDRNLQMISDDAEAEARGVYDESDNVAREQDDDEVVGRWQAMG